MQQDIQYITNKEIDKQLWNACIDKASNGLLYAYSFYLDAMADNWDALVLNNYEAVMPLPWRKKYGVYYLYQPAFIAQLGLFGNHLAETLLAAFLNAIPKKFKYWDLVLNHNNLFSNTGYPIHQRSNFILSLNFSYKDLFQNYRDNIRRNIKKAKNYGCYTSTNVAIEAVIELAKNQTKQNGKTEKDFKNFTLLYNQLQHSSKAKTYGIYLNQQLLASCVFFFSHERAYYIFVGNHPNGRTLGASHALIDAFIKDHAEQHLTLDFEGSDIRNLAFFYSSFGAVEEKYAALKLNKLPWWARWLKQ